MRHLFFTGAESGLSRSALRHGEATGRWRRVATDVYRLGSHDPTPIERALGMVIATKGAASGCLAAALLELDSIPFAGADITTPRAASHHFRRVRRPVLSRELTEVKGFPCTTGLRTMIDLANEVSDAVWEQALESALRKELFTMADLETALADLTGVRGVRRIRRVLVLRPLGAAPTGSVLETLFIQLARQVPSLPPPVRQLVVLDEHGEFIAQIDIAWPELGLFIELDGQQHAGQPVYDARRETAVVATTGWLPGRFTWHEVVDIPNTTRRRLEALERTARTRRGVEFGR